jgi:2'-hydroxyisoflavone reductase
MRMLIIGGTVFVGRALVECAMARGHEVSLFNRGNTNPDLFPDVEKLRGDRTTDEGLSALDGKTWDAVIDVSAYFPRAVTLSAEKLKDATPHYTLISTISVYDTPPEQGNITEDAPLKSLDDDTVEDVTGDTYGGLKVLCERALDETFAGRSLMIRPGLIVGPHDPTDRFTYWPIRTARGGQMLVPPRDDVLQVIDVRDLAEWTIRMVEQQATGIYNATGPDQPLSFGHVLDVCASVAGNRAATFVDANEETLSERIAPWTDFPLWLPAGRNGLMQVNNEHAVSVGLTFRPIEQTLQDTLTWFEAERGIEDTLKTGVSAEKEADIIAQN